MNPAGPELRDALLGVMLRGSGEISYHLREVLGQGGQGWVYKANYDDPDGFWVVVKVLRPEGVNSDALRRFEREADVLRLLGSAAPPNPNIVRFYDYGSYSTVLQSVEVSIPFLVLEYVEGQTLAQLIDANKGQGLAVHRVRRLMKQVARALHTVHHHRIVHRDLKPSNILLAEVQGQEIAKVTDFGLVKLPELGANQTTTLAGASLGYAPPEQYEMGNNRVTVQTDVFSFATILFEMLSGVEAFPCRPGDNPLRVVARMLTGDRPALCSVRASVSEELRDNRDVIDALDQEFTRATSPDPEVRHSSLRELWEAVEPLLRQVARPSVSASGLISEDSHSFSNAPGVPRSLGPQDPVEPLAAGGTQLIPLSSSRAQPAVTFEPQSYRTVGAPLSGERLRAGLIAEDGQSIVALGAYGLYRFSHSAWTKLSLPAGVDSRLLRCVVHLASGSLLLFGDGGFAATMDPTGAFAPFPIPDRDMTLMAGAADQQGVILVGERRSRPVGVLVDVDPEGRVRQTRSIDGTTRLLSVTRVGGNRIIAVGSHGDLVEVLTDVHREVTWGRSGHLYSVTRAKDGGAFAVGSGGHALRVAHPTTLPGVDVPPRATLEVVQTTRDLLRVTVDAAGTAWAVGAAGRLLIRRQRVWTRIPLDAVSQTSLIDVAPRADCVILLAEDGQVIEGR